MWRGASTYKKAIPGSKIDRWFKFIPGSSYSVLVREREREREGERERQREREREREREAVVLEHVTNQSEMASRPIFPPQPKGIPLLSLFLCFFWLVFWVLKLINFFFPMWILDCVSLGFLFNGFGCSFISMVHFAWYPFFSLSFCFYSSFVLGSLSFYSQWNDFDPI